MNQGKLEVFKQEMTRVNINILGISDLKCPGIGEFNSDDRYIYYCGQESLRRNVVALIVNKRVWNAVLGCSLKNDRMISVRFHRKPFSITVIQVSVLISNAEEAAQFYEDLQEKKKKSKRVPEKHLLLLYWLCQNLWLCGSQQTVEKSSRGGNTRPPYLPPQKSLCRSRSNS